MVFRWMFGLPGAALISALLFLGMAYMIRQEATTIPPVEPTDISILATLKSTAPTRTRPLREKLPDPPPTIIERAPRGKVPGPVIDPKLTVDPTKGVGKIVLPAGMQPVVKIPPAYPENCRSRGAQGVVIVEFDVTAEGDVVNPRIISSADGCLDRTVLSTIQKWKYPPPEQDGRPVARRGLREVFNFQLEG